MRLFHGSNVIVEKPRIIVSNRNLDFGMGFYTTSNLEQAKKWAIQQTKRRMIGTPLVSAYEYNSDGDIALSVLSFETAGREWLKFVTENRREEYQGPAFDIVIGPVANDTTMAVLNTYMQGEINEETALILLKPQKLSDQYAFLSYRGLNCLHFIESIHDGK